MIKKHKRSYDEDEKDYDYINGTVESRKEIEKFDDNYEDGDGDGYDVDYKKNKQTKQNKKTKKGFSNNLK